MYVNKSSALLKGLIKRVHPDKYGFANANVKTLNLACVKSLTELLNISDKIIKSLNSKSSLEVTNALPKLYSNDCFVESEIDGECRKTSFIFNTPSDLCTKQTISSSSVEKCNHVLFMELLRSYDYMKVDHPLLNEHVDDLLYYKRKCSHSNGAGDDELNGEDLADKKDYIYSRWIELELREKRRREVAMFARSRVIRSRYNTSSVLAMDDVNESILNSKKRTNHSSKPNFQYETMKAIVDLYIHSGNVLISADFSRHNRLDLEFDAVQRFKEFLIEYGDVIHFDLETYRSVIFFIHPSATTEFGSAERTFNNAKEVFGAENSGSHATRFLARVPKSLPSAETVNVGSDSVCIIDIPCDFKVKKLILFIQDTVNAVNLINMNII